MQVKTLLVTAAAAFRLEVRVANDGAFYADRLRESDTSCTLKTHGDRIGVILDYTCARGSLA